MNTQRLCLFVFLNSRLPKNNYFVHLYLLPVSFISRVEVITRGRTALQKCKHVLLLSSVTI